MRGFAQEKLGFEADVDRTVVSKIERMVGNPTLEVLVKLSFSLNVTLADLFEAHEAEQAELTQQEHDGGSNTLSD